MGHEVSGGEGKLGQTASARQHCQALLSQKVSCPDMEGGSKGEGGRV